jgi:hypothetical protein
VLLSQPTHDALDVVLRATPAHLEICQKKSEIIFNTNLPFNEWTFALRARKVLVLIVLRFGETFVRSNEWLLRRGLNAEESSRAEDGTFDGYHRKDQH